MKRFLLPVVFLASLISGCSNIPKGEPDYGPEISKEQAMNILGAYLQKSLIDPDSAKLTGDIEVLNFWYNDVHSSIFYINRHYGKLITYTINGKNSFGGYTGWQTKGLFYREGEALETFIQKPSFDGKTYWTFDY